MQHILECHWQFTFSRSSCKSCLTAASHLVGIWMLYEGNDCFSTSSMEHSFTAQCRDEMVFLDFLIVKCHFGRSWNYVNRFHQHATSYRPFNYDWCNRTIVLIVRSALSAMELKYRFKITLRFGAVLKVKQRCKLYFTSPNWFRKNKKQQHTRKNERKGEKNTTVAPTNAPRSKITTY